MIYKNRVRPIDRDALVWIEAYMRLHLIAPTGREVAQALGLPRSTARGLLGRLVARGILGRDKGRHRGLRLIGVQPWPNPTTAVEAAASRLCVEQPARPDRKRTINHNAIPWIEAYMRLHLIAPTIREVADGLGIHTSTAASMLNRLVKRRLLVRDKGRHRGLRLIGIQPRPNPQTAAEAAASKLLVAPAPPAER